MRISDWSSDVCSSDLGMDHPGIRIRPERDRHVSGRHRSRRVAHPCLLLTADLSNLGRAVALGEQAESGARFDRLQLLDVANQDQLRPRARYLRAQPLHRSEEHTSELQSLMRLSYAVFCLTK